MATRKSSKGTSGRGRSGRGSPRNDGRITEEQHDEAMRVLRAEYYQGVRSIAQDLIERAKSGEISDAEMLNDATSEAVDDSYWVIYTHANFQVLLCTDHHDEYMENFGEVPMDGRDSIKWSALAYAALERDVRDQIEAEGIEFGGGEVDERRGRMRAPRGRLARERGARGLRRGR